MKLTDPFPVVSWRILRSLGPRLVEPCAYIDARDVMDRLDEVVGPENWGTRFENIKVTTGGADRFVVVCNLTVNGVTKADGAGDTEMEAEKGAISDALKRAAVSFGIGRYLYGLKAPKVEPEVRANKKFLADDTVAYLNEWYRGKVFGNTPEDTVSEPPKGSSGTELKNWVRGLASLEISDAYELSDFLDANRKNIVAVHDDLAETWYHAVLRLLFGKVEKYLDYEEFAAYIEVLGIEVPGLGIVQQQG